MSLGQLIVKLGLDAAEFTQGMTASEAKAQRFANKMGSDIQAGAALAAGAIAALGVAAVGAFKIINDQVESIASFQQLSEKIGDTAENLASLKKASDVSGVSMDSIAAASVKLTAALSKTDEEGQGAAKAIKALGLDFDTFKKLSPVDQIDTLAKTFNKFEDGANKTAVAVALFGKAGAEVIPFLNDLAEGSERHITLTGEQIRAADEFSKALARLSSDAGVLRQQLVADLIPTLSDLLKVFTENGNSALDASSKVGVFGGAMQTIKQFIKDTAIELVTLAEWYSKITALAVGYKDVSAALLSGSLSQAREVGAAFRAEFDKTSLKYDALRAKIGAAGDNWRGKGFTDPRIVGGDDTPKPILKYDGVKTPKDKTSGGAEKQTEAEKYLANLQKQLEATDKLTVNEALIRDIQLGRLGAITPMQSLELQLIAQQIDAVKAKEAAEKEAADARKTAHELEKNSILENIKGEQDRAAAGEVLRQSVMTDMEKILELETQYGTALANNVISLETYGRLMDGLQAKVDGLTPAFLNFKDMANSAANSLADGLANAIVQGKSLGDVFKNLVKELAAMIIKAIIFKVVSGVIKSYTGIDISGARAAGGPVNSGNTYLVGEKGPELFTPSQSGKITTNQDTFRPMNVSGGGTSNVYQFSNVGAVTREEFMAGLNSTKQGAVSDVRDNQRRRRA